MNVEKCPVCNGSGKYKKKECHGCDGKGWVTIPDSPNPRPCDPREFKLNDYEVGTSSTEYDAGPYWGLSGGEGFTIPHWEKQ